eukprot:4108585-Prymnesium_polylepis.1
MPGRVPGRVPALRPPGCPPHGTYPATCPYRTDKSTNEAIGRHDQQAAPFRAASDANDAHPG